jgi:5-methyltetrahydropteroyltriglutamate--homocysteine methyltransferase
MATKYRADHVGSFLRPPELLAARQSFVEGKITEDDLRKVQDEAILKVIDLQKQSGIDIYTDGEYRRDGWASDFGEAVEGYVVGAPAVTMPFQGGVETSSAGGGNSTNPTGAPGGGGGRVFGEKLKQIKRLTGGESPFIKEHAHGAYKVTMPAASYVVTRGYKPGVTDKVYDSRAAVLHDAAMIIKDEVIALVAEGVPYVQIDNPHYPDYLPDDRREQWRALGVDPDQALGDDIDADNACLRGFDRSDVTLAMHLCRGNGAGGGWHTSGGYDRIAEQLFSRLEVDAFLLEYDSDRAGGFEPLRFMPKGKTVVLGLVTTKAGELESQDLLLRRIEEAAKFVDMDDLTLSPQCGFASTVQGNPLTWDDQLRKLELVVETARKAWGA